MIKGEEVKTKNNLMRPGNVARIKARLQWRAQRIAKLINLNVPNIILVEEIAKFQDQAYKWHLAVFNDLNKKIYDLRTLQSLGTTKKE